MGTQPETLWKQEVVARLRAAGAITLKIHGHALQASGWPDLFVGHRIFCGWAELKVDRNQCDALQRAVARQLAERGVPVVVLRRAGRVETVEDFDGAVVGELSRDGLQCMRTMIAAARAT